MKQMKIYKWLLLISGIAQLALGVTCMCYPTATNLTLIYLIAAGTLVSGIASLMFYFSIGRFALGANMLLLNGITGILLGVLFFCTDLIQYFYIAFPFVFGIFAIYKGLELTGVSTDQKLIGFKKWWVTFILAICMMGLGIACFFVPTVGTYTIAIVIGVCLVISGLCDIEGFYLSIKLKRGVQKVFNEYNQRYEYEIK